MIYTSLKGKINPYIKNLPGWRTNRKIIVIESDDWGSIRMPSSKVYQKCLQAGFQVDKIAYERYDSLASEEDLELLFDLLKSFKDKNENHPIITANSLVANPDFDKIEASGFQNYEYELITDTFKKYPKHSNCFKLWKEAIGEGIFFPQSHGREHLNVSLFMKALQRGDKDVHFGFQHGIPGSISKKNSENGNKYVESLHYSSLEDKYEKLSILLDGLKLFEDLFGFRSKSFIPPNYIWSADFDESFAKEGVRYYQGNRKMKEPDLEGGFKYNIYKLGQQNRFGQRYLIRNVLFEPSLFKMNINDPVDSCLYNINAAFQMNKPAIICSHRINYIGFLNEKNRDYNLMLLNKLLKKIIKKWPRVEFMNTLQLARLMKD